MGAYLHNYSQHMYVKFYYFYLSTSQHMFHVQSSINPLSYDLFIFMLHICTMLNKSEYTLIKMTMNIVPPYILLVLLLHDSVILCKNDNTNQGTKWGIVNDSWEQRLSFLAITNLKVGYENYISLLCSVIPCGIRLKAHKKRTMM